MLELKDLHHDWQFQLFYTVHIIQNILTNTWSRNNSFNCSGFSTQALKNKLCISNSVLSQGQNVLEIIPVIPTR